MKNLTFITITLVLIANVFTANSFVNKILDEIADRPQKEIFKVFHNLHKKSYNLNSQEGLDRYRIFKRNVAWIKAENIRIGKTLYGITQFTDMTHEEFVEKHLLKPEAFKKGMFELMKKPLRFLGENYEEHEEVHNHYHIHENFNEYEQTERKNIEKKAKENKKIDYSHNLKIGDVDYRQYDNHIKNQGTCGSCWAFAAIGAIENNYNKLTGNFTTFSEQYLVNCDYIDNGCFGGWPTSTFSWIAENGIIENKHQTYDGFQGYCNTDLKKYEYKIVKGAETFNGENQPQSEWDNLLAKGPIVVAMNASFNGIGLYRPKNFDPIRPINCGIPNHAVVVVGKVTENDEEFLLVRNSWGENWGYKGYFKIPRQNNCHISDYGWLPSVYKGKVPDNNPDPEPTKEDCIQLYGRGGFKTKPEVKACDSVTEVYYYIFYGIMLPKTTTTGKPLKVMVFSSENCSGEWAQPVEQTTEYIKRNGRDAYPASLAYIKEAQAGCISFYTEYCHKGKPSFMICEDINDTQLVNFSALSQVKSILPDSLAINRISFFTQPNFEGQSTVIEGKAIYNLDSNYEFKKFIGKGVRSVKVHKN